MLEVVPGLLLGSMGDALAVISRVPSVTKQYTVTHILTIANDPLDWSDYDQSESVASTDKNKAGSQLDGGGGHCESGDPVKGEDVMCETSDHGDPVHDESVMSDPVMGEEVDLTVTHGRFKTKFVCSADMSESDLLHHFEPCCRFIKEGVERGTVLVHWCVCLCLYVCVCCIMRNYLFIDLLYRYACSVHGISRSVTMVLAYQMWSEGRPFQVLFDNLRERKPEIRCGLTHTHTINILLVSFSVLYIPQAQSWLC